MAEKILIFGKDTWPFTTAAREAYMKTGKDFDYISVISDSRKLESMLKYSDGVRKIPVIVDQGKVTIGFDGKTWGVWLSRQFAGKNSDLQRSQIQELDIII